MVQRVQNALRGENHAAVSCVNSGNLKRLCCSIAQRVQ
jgi:hypothetical protein